MSLLQGFETMRLVKVGPSLRERLERWVAEQHHRAVIERLRSLREGVEREMKPESWTALEAPMVLLLADVCDALGLTEGEQTIVLGQEGAQALTENLETRIHPVPSPRPPMRERQGKALAFAREHGMIDLGNYRALCPYWSDETLRLDLANLVRRGLLAKNGANKGTYYTLAE